MQPDAQIIPFGLIYAAISAARCRAGYLADAGSPLVTGRRLSCVSWGMADVGLTRDDGTAALAGEHSGQGRLQRLDLGPPPYQDRAQHHPHHPSGPHRRQDRSVISRPTPARASGCRVVVAG